MKNQERLRIDIAGIVFSIVSPQDVLVVQQKSYRNFLSVEKPWVCIRASYNGLPRTVFRDSDLIFHSGGAWSLYRIDGQDAIVLGAIPPGSVPYKVALFNKNMKQVDIYNEVDGSVHNPVEYPIDEVLMICLLSQGRGLMTHACGIIDGECGYLFLGNSTHGKSTIAKLWSESGATVLNDDRIIVREKDGQFWMYGTPWHGDFNEVSPKAQPIHKIFFLKHGGKNSVVHRKGAEALTMFLTRSLLPLWDKEGMNYTLSLLDRMAIRLPCFELEFVPDKSALEFIRSYI